MGRGDFLHYTYIFFVSSHAQYINLVLHQISASLLKQLGLQHRPNSLPRSLVPSACQAYCTNGRYAQSLCSTQLWDYVWWLWQLSGYCLVWYSGGYAFDYFVWWSYQSYSCKCVYCVYLCDESKWIWSYFVSHRALLIIHRLTKQPTLPHNFFLLRSLPSMDSCQPIAPPFSAKLCTLSLTLRRWVLILRICWSRLRPVRLHPR